MAGFAIGAVPPPPAGESVPKPTNIGEAAQQFEALLLTQLLENTKPSSDDADATQDTTWGLAAQQMAQVLSKNSAFGLAKMISAGLEPKK